MSSMKPEAASRLRAPFLRPEWWSITARLTLLYAGSTALLLLLAAGYLYWGVAESLAREDRGLVSGKLQVMRVLLRERQDQPEVIASEVEHEAEANELLKYYLRVLDERGRVVVETSGMSGFLPVAVFPPAGALAAGTPPIVARNLGRGRNYLLVAGEAHAGSATGARRVIQVALDIAHNETILADYRRNLIAALGLGLAVAALAGIAVARAGLRPLRAIARTARDITASKLDQRVVPAHWPRELRELAQSFDAMLDRLQDSFARLNEFSGDIAHAMRNPINSLRGEAEVALSRARTPEEYQQILGSSLEELARLSHLINGLLFIARADDPHAAVERAGFAARRELDAVRDFYEALAAEQQVTVECEGDAPVVGDPMLFRRAVSNLLGNSLKHTPAGGRVTLSARSDAAGAVEITVVDSGHGIAPEHLPRIFDRFFKIDPVRADAPKGAGLGLAIVQSIMRLHGGSVSAASRVGVGTTITLRFPAQGAAPVLSARAG